MRTAPRPSARAAAARARRGRAPPRGPASSHVRRATPPDGGAAGGGDALRLEEAATAPPSPLDPPQAVVITELPPETAPADGDDISIGSIMRFTLPTAAIWVTGPILGLVDSSVVGLRSSVELAALGPGTVCCDYAAYCLTWIANAVANSAALLFARADGDGASAMLSDAVGLSLLLGAALSAFMWFLGPPCAAGLAGTASADVVPHAVTYIRWRAAAAPAAVVSFAVQAFFLAARNTRVPLAAAVFAAGANLAGDIALVCGLGLGIAGAAAATVAAQFVSTFYLVARLARPLNGAAPAGWTPSLVWRLPSPAAAASFLGYAGPVVALLGAKVALYTYLSKTAATGGPAAAAAHHLAISSFLLFACAGDAVSAGAQAWLPAAIGAPRRARRVAAALLRAGATAGAANVAVVGGVLAASARLFTSDPAVASALTGVAPLVALTLGLHTCSMATEGMLLAARDLTFQAGANFVNCAVCVWLVRAIGGAAPSLTNVWSTLCVFQALRLALNGARLWISPRSPLAQTQGLKAQVA